MKPGRELDALVAEKIFVAVVKWHEEPVFNGTTTKMVNEPYSPYPSNPRMGMKRLPKYSADIAAAWEVLGALRARDPESFFTLSFAHEASLKLSGTVYKTVGSSDAHAICLIALKAVGVEIPEEH